MIPYNSHHGDSMDRRVRARAVLNALLSRYRGYSRDAGEQELVDALFVDVGEGARTLTGISEMSVSWRGGRWVAVRALAEVLHRRTLDPELATRGLQWGTEMLHRLSTFGDSYSIPLFRQIYGMLYLNGVAEPATLFRFGIATEFADVSPILKVYFDLHATKLEYRQHILDQIVALLDGASNLEVWKRAYPDIDMATSRVIGVDFGAGNTVRAKFYWGARHLSWNCIDAASREISGERHAETLRRLRCEVCSSSDALSSMLVSMCAANGKCSMKLDICIARLYENDSQAYDAIKRFCGSTVDADRPTSFELVSGGLQPCWTKCIQQYLSVELPPDRSSRITIYYRPIGFETEHLNTALLPRMCK